MSSSQALKAIMLRLPGCNQELTNSATNGNHMRKAEMGRMRSSRKTFGMKKTIRFLLAIQLLSITVRSSAPHGSTDGNMGKLINAVRLAKKKGGDPNAGKGSGASVNN